MRIYTKSSGSAKDLRGFVVFADRKLFETTKDILDYGQRRMTEIVPKGQSHKLADGVMSEGPTVISPGHFAGRVFVDHEIAPHAGFVDKGTGVDGPLHRPVTITRPARKDPNKPGRMMFMKEGEGAKFRTTVKIHPSSKIEAGKNFSGRTYDSMKTFTRVRIVYLAGQLAGYFRRH